MTVRGQVKNGVIVLDTPAALPEGAEVEVNLIDHATGDRAPNPPTDDGKTLYDRLKPVIGQAHGLPPDLAENHDHYLHGQPKK